MNSTGRRNTSMMRCCDAETETETVRPGGSACGAFAWSAAGSGACGAATVLEGDRAGLSRARLHAKRRYLRDDVSETETQAAGCL